MKLQKPKNPNYCFTVVEIKNIIPLENRDNIVHTNIFGNLVIVSKDTEIGMKGIYIPVETQLSENFCYENNLYDKAGMNKNPDKKGYISFKTRRIRALKLGGHESNGMFMPLDSLNYILPNVEDILNIGMEFDEINGIEVCQKYIPVIHTKISGKNNPQGQRPKKVFKIVDHQFHFHIDITHLGKNIHRFNSDDIIDITEKVHGTSHVSSKPLVNNYPKWFTNLDAVFESFNNKLVGFTRKHKKFQFIQTGFLNIFNTFVRFGKRIAYKDYDGYGIFSSRKVIKNEDINSGSGFYGINSNVWKYAHEVLKNYMPNGMSIYAEIVGYLPNGKMVQKHYDYGCIPPKNKYKYGENFKIFIYRITMTNIDGQVFEFSANQVQKWCHDNGLMAVPQKFYGKLKEYIGKDIFEDEEVLNKMRIDYWYDQDPMCIHNVPNEGIVVRNDSSFSIEAYKFKNFKFLQYETKQMDKEHMSVEDEES